MPSQVECGGLSSPPAQRQTSPAPLTMADAEAAAAAKRSALHDLTNNSKGAMSSGYEKVGRPAAASPSPHLPPTRRHACARLARAPDPASIVPIQSRMRRHHGREYNGSIAPHADELLRSHHSVLRTHRGDRLDSLHRHPIHFVFCAELAFPRLVDAVVACCSARNLRCFCEY